MPETQPWDNFFDGLETGDVILMRGMFKSSIFIEDVSFCHWSHSAIVAISDDLGIAELPSGTVLLWESNVMNDMDKKVNPDQLSVTDVILGTAKGGPILDRLKERITNNHVLGYDSDVAKRKLTFQRSNEMYQQFQGVIENVHKYDFPAIPMGEMGNYVMGLADQIPVTDNTFFCSQLLTHTFKAFGLIDNTYVDNSYAPFNYAEGFRDTYLLKGAKLGPEIRLDITTIPKYPGY